MNHGARIIYPIVASLLSCCCPSVSATDIYNLNPDWRLFVGDIGNAHETSFDDKSWKQVSLPRAHNEDEAFRIPIAEMTDTVAWYRKHFNLPAEADGKKIFIEFEGARQGADVYLNGRHIGANENGIMAFGFDVTPFVNYGQENILAVRTDNDWHYRERSSGNAYQWNDKNFNANYGGLPKNVRLHICPRVYQTLPLYSSLGTTGVYVYAKNIDTARRTADIFVESQVRNESNQNVNVGLEVRIIAPGGQTVASFSSKPVMIASGGIAILKTASAVGGLHFWSWGYGYLYDVETRLNVNGRLSDTVVTRTGFRKTEFGDGMFRLNDRVMMIHGYAQRSSNEWPGVGMSVPPWLSDYSNLQIINSGGNLVRWMHVTPWKQDVESCDRVGLLQAMPAGDSEKDISGRRWEHRVDVMRDAIIYNRNNPSIIFYESGNKGISEAHMAEMKAIRDTFDPHGGRAIGSREMLDSETAEYGGEMLYINKSARQPLWAMEYCRDEGLRRYHDDWSYPYHRNGDGPLYRGADASAYNLNQDQLAIEHIRRWHDYWQVRPGTGRRVSSGGVKIIFSDTQTHCRGESDYRTSGVTDAMRIPKDSYYAHRVMWDGWVTPEKSHTYIIGHWNYDEATVKPVYVVSDAPRVELLLNGKTVGHERIDCHFLHVFDSIPYEPGTLKAISYDNNAKKLSEHTISTAGRAERLKLTLSTAPGGMKADGRDIAMVEFETVDRDGNRCPLDNRKVNFRLEGPAEWRGGIAKGEGNCVLSTTLPVECGVNRALIRSTGKEGKIRLYAKADNLPEEMLEWTAQGIGITGGITQFRQSDCLPGYLGRGETPAHRSYEDVKTSLHVVGLQAGCNEDSAYFSIDDNERSEWSNDGSLQNAWITYHFESPCTVDEAELKLAGWRKRSYPIEILTDNGEIVWEGDTEKSLGYVNLKLRPVETRSLTIRLKGAATEKEGFGQITELDKNNEDSLTQQRHEGRKSRKAELRIIEADFLKNCRK